MMDGRSLRYWRTGAMAVVSGRAQPDGQRDATRTPRGGRWRAGRARSTCPIPCFTSEDSARRRGMAVFARSLRGAGTRVIVLESAHGGTPVVMQLDAGAVPGAAAERDRQGVADGRAEVLSGVAGGWLAMPHALAQDLAELNAVVGDALRYQGPASWLARPESGSLFLDPAERACHHPRGDRSAGLIRQRSMTTTVSATSASSRGDRAPGR